MADNNREASPPRTPAAAGGKLVSKVNFDTGHPIFWGPNQGFAGTNTFVEPDWGSNKLEYLSIPKVVRMVVGDLISDRCQDDPPPFPPDEYPSTYTGASMIFGGLAPPTWSGTPVQASFTGVLPTGTFYVSKTGDFYGLGGSVGIIDPSFDITSLLGQSTPRSVYNAVVTLSSPGPNPNYPNVFYGSVTYSLTPP